MSLIVTVFPADNVDIKEYEMALDCAARTIQDGLLDDNCNYTGNVTLTEQGEIKIQASISKNEFIKKYPNLFRYPEFKGAEVKEM